MASIMTVKMLAVYTTRSLSDPGSESGASLGSDKLLAREKLIAVVENLENQKTVDALIQSTKIREDAESSDSTRLDRKSTFGKCQSTRSERCAIGFSRRLT
ncbi:MAG: hypothetical protein A3G24_25990 [Betaproteobacteria bacterium RIFCSPLOWO2_12_FULL_62_13]|nr:MAG: hypothetical protein A3G24_25990 [Betaproteobacteria bacterium RIFCSPLOWO2_12_FULL_62_13]